MRRVIVVSPHPDDESVGCGGTICSHVADRDQVKVVFLSSGELGGHGEDPSITGPRREAEAAAALAVLGVTDHEFWRLPDAGIRASARTVARVQRVFAEYRPDIVYVPHDREQHRDHAAAARVVRRALDDDHAHAREPTPKVLGFEVWTPLESMDEIVDVSEFIDQKLLAIRQYESQCRVLPFDAAFLGLARYRGEMHSWPGGPYAEVFKRLR